MKIIKLPSLLFLLFSLLTSDKVFAVPRAFFIDSRVGSDTNPGTKERPWKSLTPINNRTFEPGDQVLFASGSSFYGCLTIKSSGREGQPIVFSSYGKGTKPRFANPFFEEHSGRCFQVEGSHVIVEKLFFYDTPTPVPDKPPVEFRQSRQHKQIPNVAAIFIDKKATNVVVQQCEFSNTVFGIRVRGSHSKILHNYLHDASKITEQWGAVGIVVVGPHNEIAYNRIENFGYYGGNFGMDGAAIELDGEDPDYDAHDIYIHHNISRNTKGGFCEITGNRAYNVTFEHNYSDDIDKFVGTVGVKNVKILNNTIIRMRNPELKQIVFWQLDRLDNSRPSEYYLENNLIYVNKNVFIYNTPYKGWGIKEQSRTNNLYFSPDTTVVSLLGIPPNRTDYLDDPQLVEGKDGLYQPGKGSVVHRLSVGAFVKPNRHVKVGVVNK